jgi:hypothetical protein
MPSTPVLLLSESDGSAAGGNQVATSPALVKSLLGSELIASGAPYARDEFRGFAG